MTLPRFHVAPESLLGTSAVLEGPELHHLRVRRLRLGDALVLIDGTGHERRGTVAEISRHQAMIRFVGISQAGRGTPIRLVLAQALLKSDKLDLVIEKATELGVAEILLFTSERTVRVGDSAGRRQRWNRIAAAAAKQSQRASIPQIQGPVPFGDILHREPSAVRLLFWEAATSGQLLAINREFPAAHTVMATVGPEGGFSVAEATTAAAHGLHLVGLNVPILRAETAAIVAVALCQFLWCELPAARDGSDVAPSLAPSPVRS